LLLIFSPPSALVAKLALERFAVFASLKLKVGPQGPAFPPDFHSDLCRVGFSRCTDSYGSRLSRSHDLRGLLLCRSDLVSCASHCRLGRSGLLAERLERLLVRCGPDAICSLSFHSGALDRPPTSVGGSYLPFELRYVRRAHGKLLLEKIPRDLLYLSCRIAKRLRVAGNTFCAKPPDLHRDCLARCCQPVPAFFDGVGLVGERISDLRSAVPLRE
jgi:hypothetical protein